MRLNALLISSIFMTGSFIAGCAVVPEPEPEVVVQAPIVVAPPQPLCFEVAELKRVEIPAETKTIYTNSVIENPPYEPIEQRAQQEIIVKQAEVFYVKEDPQTGNQTEVTAFCDPNVQTGPIGPAEGEFNGPPVPVN